MIWSISLSGRNGFLIVIISYPFLRAYFLIYSVTIPENAPYLSSSTKTFLMLSVTVLGKLIIPFGVIPCKNRTVSVPVFPFLSFMNFFAILFAKSTTLSFLVNKTAVLKLSFAISPQIERYKETVLWKDLFMFVAFIISIRLLLKCSLSQNLPRSTIFSHVPGYLSSTICGAVPSKITIFFSSIITPSSESGSEEQWHK